MASQGGLTKWVTRSGTKRAFPHSRFRIDLFRVITMPTRLTQELDQGGDQTGLGDQRPERRLGEVGLHRLDAGVSSRTVR